MALSLVGKHCAVVGGTGIIGSHIALAFAQKGAVVTVLGRTALDAARELGPRLSSCTPAEQRPVGHRFIPLDVSDKAAMESVFGSMKQTTEAVGPVDVLVNCAGISQHTLLKRTPQSVIGEVVDTNLVATMMACKHARLTKEGCIINVSSLMANKGGFGAAAYAASKAGVIAFTRAFCLEMKPRAVRVNVLLPGWIESKMWDDLRDDLKMSFIDQTPLSRPGKPEEVADAAVFLASNGFANNCVLNLDGGLSAS